MYNIYIFFMSGPQRLAEVGIFFFFFGEHFGKLK